MKRIGRIALWSLAGLALIVAIIAIGLLATYPAEYLRRLVAYGNSDNWK